MQPNNIFLVCKSGGDFNFQDVELLVTHIKKECSVPVNIYCLYDKVSTPLKLKDVTLLPFEHNDWPGWWGKLDLFSPALEQYRPFLYFDLDTAIVGDIAKFFQVGENESAFINLSDFYKPVKTLANAIMWIPANNEKVQKVWDKWIESPTRNMGIHRRGDMFFIGSVVETDLYWQDITDKISSFKPRVNRKIEWLKELPEHLAVVCFHGKPRIREAQRIDWIYKYIKNI